VFKLIAENLSHRFEGRTVFRDVSLDLTTGQSLAVIGPNGAGKSTLLQCLLGLLRPVKGVVRRLEEERSIEISEFGERVGFVAPYVQLYDQLTGEENIKFFTALSARSVTGKDIDAILERVGLEGRGGDEVRAYSSGMKQRLKYAVALAGQPDFLFLDEPTANLDDAGRKIVFDLVEEYRSRTIMVIATNETEEYRLAEQTCQLG